VVRQYLDAVNEDEAAHSGSGSDDRGASSGARLGSGEVRVTRLEYLDGSGAPSQVLVSGEPATFRMHFFAEEPVADPVFGLGFAHESGVSVAGPNSSRSGLLARLHPGPGRVDFHVPRLTFQPGSFEVTTAIVHKGHVYDYADRLFDLKVRGGGTDEPGLVQLPGSWSIPDPTAESASVGADVAEE
jgi:ABC-2 type transport system ATP-binding protein/lipopolysaccharide transport system ATP-binding protein